MNRRILTGDVLRHDFDVIEDTLEARRDYRSYDDFECWINAEDIRALQDGKALVATINGCEYTVFITLHPRED